MSGSKAAKRAQDVRLQIVCAESLECEWAGVRTEFGLQGRQRAIHPGLAQADGSLAFALIVTATYRPEASAVRFSGPFVHGTADDPFLYLSLREVKGEPTAWIRRLKVPLAGLTWERIADRAEGSAFITRVSGTRGGRAAVLGQGWSREDAADTDDARLLAAMEGCTEGIW